MPKVQITPVTLIAGAVLIVLAYTWLRGIKGVASDVITIVDETSGAVIMKAASVFGIPETDVKLCEKHVKAGEWWNASLYCPAGTFFKAASGAIINATTGERVGYTEDDPGDPDIVYMLN
jgi:hypothetical protein